MTPDDPRWIKGPALLTAAHLQAFKTGDLVLLDSGHTLTIGYPNVYRSVVIRNNAESLIVGWYPKERT